MGRHPQGTGTAGPEKVRAMKARPIGFEAVEAMAEMCREQTSFTTEEIAQRLGIEAWRVRRSLKSMASSEYAMVWSSGGDRWTIDPRLVRLLRHVKDLKELEESK
jgi:DNA-binding IclR family transcriptional regulator